MENTLQLWVFDSICSKRRTTPYPSIFTYDTYAAVVSRHPQKQESEKKTQLENDFQEGMPKLRREGILQPLLEAVHGNGYAQAGGVQAVQGKLRD